MTTPRSPKKESAPRPIMINGKSPRRQRRPRAETPKRPTTPNTSRRRGRQRKETNNNNSQAAATTTVDWFRELTNAIRTGRWEHLRGILSMAVSQQDTLQSESTLRTSAASSASLPPPSSSSPPQSPTSRKASLWRRLANSVTGNTTNSQNNNMSPAVASLFHAKQGLLKQEVDFGRTPLHFGLYHGRHTPTDILLLLLRLEPSAASIPETHAPQRRYPLHTAVIFQLHMEVIAALVEAYPAALSQVDAIEQSPLAYAMDRAMGDTDLRQAPETLWMPIKEEEAPKESSHGAAGAEISEDEETTTTTTLNNNKSTASAAEPSLPPSESTPPLSPQNHDNDDATQKALQRARTWQEAQVDRWAIVHWLLLASATHPQTSLSVGGKKPMLVDALIYAAPSAVIALLIGASSVLLSFEKRATAFAGTTLYTCLSRHYPLPILWSICAQCPRDVRLVQDETGMGLVAAQFVAGFFRKVTTAASAGLGDEWRLVTDFMVQAQHVLEHGTLPAPAEQYPGFLDWWEKVEFLIAFCTGQPLKSESNFPSQYLLHAALGNADVPPVILRLLLALHPDSLKLPAPETQQLPLVVACATPEYIPRFYEWQLVGSPLLSSQNHSAVGLVLHADPTQVLARTPNDPRLPLHVAIDAGKLYASLQPLIDAAPETLAYRDPTHFLYPWLHVAAVGTALELSQHQPNDENAGAANNNNPTPFDAHSRWAFYARNKYTHHVWRGLSDRQRHNAVQKQYYSLEVLERLTTSFQLLRRAPHVVSGTALSSSWRQKKRGPIREARDETGMGTVAQHYLNFIFQKQPPPQEHGGGGGLRQPNEEHVDIFRRAIRLAPSGDWSTLPPEFERWFMKMRFWIKYCCPKQSASKLGQGVLLSGSNHSNDSAASFLPTSNERYTLHMAVLNPDTPPPVIQLILAVSLASASMRIPNTQLLPLHLAAQTFPYVPRPYETARGERPPSVLALLVQAHAHAVSEATDEGLLPLHLAIQAGRAHWKDELEPLVRPDPSVLTRCDPRTRLYPFQLMAVRRTFTRADRMRFLYLARNQCNHCPQEHNDNEDHVDWDDKTPLQQTAAVRWQQRQYQLDVLTSIFELFRANVSVLPTAYPPPSAVPVAATRRKSPATAATDALPISSFHMPQHIEESSSFDHSEALTEAETIFSSSRHSHSRRQQHLSTPAPATVNQGYIPAVLQTHGKSKSSRQLTTTSDSDHSDKTPERGTTTPSSSTTKSSADPLHFPGSQYLDSLSNHTSRTPVPDLDFDQEHEASSGGFALTMGSNSHHTSTSHESDLIEIESQTSNRSGSVFTSTMLAQPRSSSLLPASAHDQSISSSEGSRIHDAPGKASLMRLLSQQDDKDGAKNDEDVYECDASILSNLDVMSTLSSTIHNVTGHSISKHRRYGSGASGMYMVDSFSEDEEDGGEEDRDDSEYFDTTTDGGESSGVEFGEESVGRRSYHSFAGDESSTALSLPVPSDFLRMVEKDQESETENGDQSEDDGELVTFQYRRKPRSAYWEDHELVNAPARLPSGRRTGSARVSADMDTSSATNPLAQMAMGRHSTASTGSSDSLPIQQRSLKSHLSDLTTSVKGGAGESRHTSRSFATDGSANRSFATEDQRSFALTEESESSVCPEDGEDTCATPSVGGASRDSSSVRPPSPRKPAVKANMEWVSDGISRTENKEAPKEGGGGEEEATEQTGEDEEHDFADDEQEEDEEDDKNPVQAMPSALIGKVEPGGHNMSDSGTDFSMGSSMSDMLDPSKAIGMMWLDDSSESGHGDSSSKLDALLWNADSTSHFSDSRLDGLDGLLPQSDAEEHNDDQSLLFGTNKSLTEGQREEFAAKSSSSSTQSSVRSDGSARSTGSGQSLRSTKGPSTHSRTSLASLGIGKHLGNALSMGSSAGRDDESESSFSIMEFKAGGEDGKQKGRESNEASERSESNREPDPDTEADEETETSTSVDVEEFKKEASPNAATSNAQTATPEMEESVIIEEVFDESCIIEEIVEDSMMFEEVVEEEDSGTMEEEIVESAVFEESFIEEIIEDSVILEEIIEEEESETVEDDAAEGSMMLEEIIEESEESETVEESETEEIIVQSSVAILEKVEEGSEEDASSSTDDANDDAAAGVVKANGVNLAMSLEPLPETTGANSASHEQVPVPGLSNGSVPSEEVRSLQKSATDETAATSFSDEFDFEEQSGEKDGFDFSGDAFVFDEDTAEVQSQWADFVARKSVEGGDTEEESSADREQMLSMAREVQEKWAGYMANAPIQDDSEDDEAEEAQADGGDSSAAPPTEKQSLEHLPESNNPRLETIEEVSISSSQLSKSSSHVSIAASAAELLERKESKNDMYFDRAAMKWVSRKSSVAREVVIPDRSKSAGNYGARTEGATKLTFDRATFRWREVKESKPRSGSEPRGTKEKKRKPSPSVKLQLSAKSSTLRKPLRSIPERRDPSPLPGGDLLCLICEQDTRQVVMKPCFHLAICSRCSGKFREICTCPLCQREVNDRIHITS